MKTLKIVVALTALASAAAMTGCADLAQSTGANQSTTGAVLGAAGGAVAGSVLGRTLNLDRTATAAIGAAVGGAIGYTLGRAEDIKAAEAAKARIEQRGFKAVVELEGEQTSQAMKLPASTQPQVQAKEPTLKRFAAPIPAVALRTQAPEARDTLRDIGAVAASNSAPTSVYITAPNQKSADWAKGEVLAGAGNKPSVRVVASVSKDAGVTMLPDYTAVASASR